VPSPIPAFAAHSLALLGVLPHRLIPLDRSTVYHASRLYLPAAGVCGISLSRTHTHTHTQKKKTRTHTLSLSLFLSLSLSFTHTHSQSLTHSLTAARPLDCLPRVARRVVSPCGRRLRYLSISHTHFYFFWLSQFSRYVLLALSFSPCSLSLSLSPSLCFENTLSLSHASSLTQTHNLLL
jgi:hypothetical protein